MILTGKILTTLLFNSLSLVFSHPDPPFFFYTACMLGLEMGGGGGGALVTEITANMSDQLLNIFTVFAI